MSNVIYLNKWRRTRRNAGQTRRANQPRGLVSIGEVSAELLRRLTE